MPSMTGYGLEVTGFVAAPSAPLSAAPGAAAAAEAAPAARTPA
jgi:hypothetical protein